MIKKSFFVLGKQSGMLKKTEQFMNISPQDQLPATAAVYRKPFHPKTREEELLDFSTQWQRVQCQQLHNAFTLKPTPPPAPLLSLQTALFQILTLADMKCSYVKPWSAFWDQRMPQWFVLWSILGLHSHFHNGWMIFEVSFLLSKHTRQLTSAKP